MAHNVLLICLCRTNAAALADCPVLHGYGCATAEVSAVNAELKSYKADVRAKTIAVGKAEITLNEVCLLMARRVGRAEGTQLSDTKGGVLLEVCVRESPACGSAKGSVQFDTESTDPLWSGHLLAILERST